jgi:hypothetical protein
MKRLALMTLALLIGCIAVSVGRAQWGWPPPGYSVTGVRACDGSRYRGLCQVLRDRRCRSRGCSALPETPGPKWDGTLPNSENGRLHQPTPLPKEPFTPQLGIR